MAVANRKYGNPDNRSFLGSAVGGVFTFAAFGVLAAVFAWNWDGFWQTDIGGLNALQQRFFPAKFNEEQLKLSRVLDNSAWMTTFERRLAVAEAGAESERQRAAESQSELAALRAKDNTNCRYYKASLKIINNLAKKIPPEGLRTSASCTKAECEQIIRARPEALSICD